MKYIGFQEYFEAIAETQTRSFLLRGDPKIPDGDYALLTMYCADKKCDCRRALVNVLQVSPEFGPLHAATISYGWESNSFYKKWAPHLEEKDLLMFKGPALDIHQTQSPYARLLLEKFIEIALDDEYTERLERQYAMFKYKQGMKLPPSLLKLVGIYEPCPCGSGKNFKMCCGKAGMAKRLFKR